MNAEGDAVAHIRTVAFGLGGRAEPGFFAALKNDTTKLLTGTKSRIFSYDWVQGSPLPKEA